MRNRTFFLYVFTGVLVVSVGSFASAVEPYFQVLGDLVDPANEWDFPAGVSDDGSVIVGQMTSDAGSTWEAFRWTAGTGMVGLGYLPGGGSEAVAWGISGNGAVIVGGSDSGPTFEAFRWTASDGMIGLGHLPGGGTFSEANAVSRDGSVIAGQSDSDAGHQAFIWTQADGMQGLGFLPGGSYSLAYAVSGNGSMVFGQSESDSGLQAFRWTAAQGMVSLGDLPGGEVYGCAEGCSDNGQFVVGGSSSAASDTSYEPFLWSATTGMMMGLGDLPGGIFCGQANAVSHNGSVVVGNSHVGMPAPPDEPLFAHAAFIWNETDGMRSLQDVLENDLGLDLRGLTLNSATGISADGRTIVGWATQAEGSRRYFSHAWLVCMAETGDIPTLTEWGLIIFGVVLLGFITWVFLRRRKVIGVRI